MQKGNRGIGLLEKYQINMLFHITQLSNIGHIFKYGLLCHQKAHNVFNKRCFGISIADISDSEVQQRRKNKLLNNKTIHQYVCLYFNPKNPMLYSRKSKQDELIILGIDPNVLLEEGVYFSDGNAAASNTKFYNNLESLDLINWEILKTEGWSDQPDWKRIKCAEALAPFTISFQKIEKIFCYNTKQIQTIKLIIQGLKESKKIDISTDLEVKKELYF
jgi:hypothetical protein